MSKLDQILQFIAEDFVSDARSAGFHDSIFRGKNLTNIYSVEEICARIAAGTFGDLYIGDYFDITITPAGQSAETVRCMLAGFDCYLHNGDTAITRHHAVIVPMNSFATTAQMNPTNTTAGGYAESAMHTTALPKYATALKTVFGSHLLKYRNLPSISISSSGASMAGAGFTGYSNSWEWQDCELRLMTEVELYGSTVCSSSFYDTGIGKSQLPLFALAPEYIRAGLGGTDHASLGSFWLSAVASATSFAYCSYYGRASSTGASTSIGVRPLWLIG